MGDPPVGDPPVGDPLIGDPPIGDLQFSGTCKLKYIVGLNNNNITTRTALGPRLRLLRLSGVGLRRAAMARLVGWIGEWPELQTLELSHCFCDDHIL